MESHAARRLQRLMRRMCFAALIATTANVVRAEEAYQLKVVTDRADAIYETNATAKFLVKVTKGKQPVTEGKVSYIVDDFITEIPPSSDFPVPDDFDEFWKQQKAQLAKVAMDPKLTLVEQSNADLDCFDVQVSCLGGAPVSGYLASGCPKIGISL